MQAFPHHYRVDSEATHSSEVILRSNGVRDLPSTAPKEFGGSGREWSPEGLLVAAVADCFIFSFKAIATASKLTWEHISCQAVGTLDRVDRVTQFTLFEFQVTLRVPAEADPALAERLLKKAENICLITNSLKAECSLNYDLEVS
jgi:peroxiredoxin-like protein